MKKEKNKAKVKKILVLFFCYYRCFCRKNKFQKVLLTICKKKKEKK